MPDLSEGAVFAGHRIEGVAGRGGMGTVYRATHIALDHLVALKVIAPDLATDDSFRERFKSESRIAVSMRHPNVVPIHHAGEEDGLLFVTMDLIDGPDLRKLLIARGPLEGEQAVAILEQVASALDVAHSRGLVHRDIKPGNILIEEGAGDHAYLTDFGLTKRMEGASAATALTSTGAFVGTLDYVAPEQIRGDDLDATTDVYALGCVLHEMLTASPPFAGREEKVAKMYAHLQDDPEPLLGRNKVFNDVILRALAKEQDERYPSAGDLARGAAAALQGRSVDTAERSVGVGPAAPTAAHETPAEFTQPDEAQLDATQESEAPGLGGEATEKGTRPYESDEVPTAPATPRPDEESETGRNGGKVPPRTERTAVERPGRSSRTPLTLAAIGLVAAIAVGAVLILGGGGDEDEAPTTATFAPTVGSTIDGGEFPVGVAQGGDDVYIADRNGRAVLGASVSSEAIEKPVKLDNEPEDVVVEGGSVYVTVPLQGGVLRFDRELQGSESIPAPGSPMALTVADGSVWTVGAESGTVYEIKSDGTTEETDTPAQNAFGIAVTDTDLWVVGRDDDAVWQVPRGDGEPLSHGVGDNPKGVAVAGDLVYVANTDSSTLSVLDENDGSEVAEIDLGGAPRDVTVLGDHVWVSNENGSVTPVEVGATGPLDDLNVGGSPEGLGVGAEQLWVATGGAGKSVRAITP
jgi:YVTN family beta-propeller protein